MKNEETSEHLFLECPFQNKSWFEISLITSLPSSGLTPQLKYNWRNLEKLATPPKKTKLFRALPIILICPHDQEQIKVQCIINITNGSAWCFIYIIRGSAQCIINMKKSSSCMFFQSSLFFHLSCYYYYYYFFLSRFSFVLAILPLPPLLILLILLLLLFITLLLGDVVSTAPQPWICFIFEGC